MEKDAEEFKARGEIKIKAISILEVQRRQISNTLMKRSLFMIACAYEGQAVAL